MLTLIGKLGLIALVNAGFAQVPANGPADPPLVAAACCVATAAPVGAPPPQGTNKGLLAEPFALTSLVGAIVSRARNEGHESSGPYLKFSSGVQGSGWIALGPGYTRVFDERLMIDVSAAVTWRRYLNGRARFEFRPQANQSVTFGAQVLGQDWTQVKYFGLGQDSREEDSSIYRLRATDVSAYATLSPRGVVDVRVRGGMLSRPRISAASGWNKSDDPDTLSLFTDASAPGLNAQPRFWHADLSLSRNTLDHPDHPTRGLFMEVAVSQFDDRDLDRYSFRRYEATTIGFVPIVGNKWTLGARAMVVHSGTSGSNEIPFYMLPGLGQTVLRGFDTARFHDRNLMALNVESRWAIFQHLDAAVFGDFGHVAPNFGDLSWSDRKSSYGVGLRLHTGASTFFRVDAARAGGGGWRMMIKLHESLSWSKTQRWNTVVPVVR